MLFSRQKQKAGFSLIEAAVVLGVVGLVIGGIWVAAAAVAENQRQSTVLQQTTTIIHNIRQRWPIGTRFGCWGDSSCTVSEYSFHDQDGYANYIPRAGWDGIVPASMITSAIRPLSPWGKPILITLRSAHIEIIYYTLPRSSCVSLAPRMAAAAGNQLISITSGASLDVRTPELASTNCSTSITLQVQR